MKNQEAFITKHLLDYGKISRNFCLQHFVSRLGAYICDLNKSGWEIEGHFEKGEYGCKDFIYVLKSSPFKKVIRTVPSLGLEIVSYDKLAR